MSLELAYVCAGCGLLALASRKDTLTCSTACRVRAHRNGSLEALRATAKGFDIHPAGILQARAAQALTPDRVNEVHAGRVTLDDLQPDMCRALAVLAMRVAALGAAT